ncbi:sterol desaturase family protein [Sulfitobacter sp. M368]|uniref:sterol desaturase family protein n=1 Tax=Sulfitobacter sp. M368 TaxID=2867021 RepID=UPI0021A8F8F1|nr:sterol desaturase family protein [Sulfitobacter sp. M368]UWR16244.1 sterol desaturase family protein [Sulfitobacter sp. M368]
MTQALLENEARLRILVFLLVLLIMAIWEIASPRRRRDIPRLLRWSNNLAIVVLDAALVRLLFPVVAVGFAVIAQQNGWGLLNLLALPQWLAVVVSLLLFDLAIYLQHVVFHAVPALWRLHRMHHADLEFDVTTGLRFHPVEIILSMAVKMTLVLILGPPAIAVLLFEVVLNASAMFNHANVHLPNRLDRMLRLVLVTPDMHRVHHSDIPAETHSNFGFNLPWWDRIFGTYTAQPRKGHTGMTIGLPRFRTRRDLWLDRMLMQPLRGDEETPRREPSPPSGG